MKTDNDYEIQSFLELFDQQLAYYSISPFVQIKINSLTKCIPYMTMENEKIIIKILKHVLDWSKYENNGPHNKVLYQSNLIRFYSLLNDLDQNTDLYDFLKKNLITHNFEDINHIFYGFQYYHREMKYSSSIIDYVYFSTREKIEKNKLYDIKIFMAKNTANDELINSLIKESFDYNCLFRRKILLGLTNNGNLSNSHYEYILDRIFNPSKHELSYYIHEKNTTAIIDIINSKRLPILNIIANYFVNKKAIEEYHMEIYCELARNGDKEIIKRIWGMIQKSFSDNKLYSSLLFNETYGRVLFSIIIKNENTGFIVLKGIEKLLTETHDLAAINEDIVFIRKHSNYNKIASGILEEITIGENDEKNTK